MKPKITSLPSGLPGCLKKRRLLNDRELSPEMCRDLGDKFLAQGWLEDALEFYRKGGCQEGLEKLLAMAMDQGDAYLLRRLGIKDPKLWRQAAEQALRSGKSFFAWQALKEAGEHEQAENLAHELKEDGWLPSP